jgi:hypothetical protein
VICPQCHDEFEPRRPHQRYCGKVCRMQHYQQTTGDGALRGVISGVRVLKTGGTSITVQFALPEAQNALKLRPGQVLEVVA